MQKTDYKKRLLDMVEKAVKGEWSFKEFEASFYWFFIDDVPADALDDEASWLFFEIQEMLEYTVEEPPEEDRKYGYVNEEEYLHWLREFVKKNQNFFHITI